MEITDLTPEQTEVLEDHLSAYDEAFIHYKLEGTIRIGILEEGQLIAGLNACMTAFRILYVSTLFVAPEYRRKGYGKRLMQEMESRAKALGANTIRLDTFNWQGTAFYKALGYTEVGHYEHEEDGYAESFFLKRI